MFSFLKWTLLSFFQKWHLCHSSALKKAVTMSHHQASPPGSSYSRPSRSMQPPAMELRQGALPPDSKSKFEKLPRPTFSLDMTEGDWAYSTMQWESYIAQAPASPAEQLLQLRAACDDS